MMKRSGLPRGCTYEAELLTEWPNCAEAITHLCPYSSPAQRKPDWQRWVVSRCPLSSVRTTATRTGCRPHLRPSQCLGSSE